MFALFQSCVPRALSVLVCLIQISYRITQIPSLTELLKQNIQIVRTDWQKDRVVNYIHSGICQGLHANEQT